MTLKSVSRIRSIGGSLVVTIPKEIVKEKGKSYLHKLKEENPDKLKEYRRTAYLNRKSKLQNTTIENI